MAPSPLIGHQRKYFRKNIVKGENRHLSFTDPGQPISLNDMINGTNGVTWVQSSENTEESTPIGSQQTNEKSPPPPSFQQKQSPSFSLSLTKINSFSLFNNDDNNDNINNNDNLNNNDNTQDENESGSSEYDEIKRS